MVQIPDAKMNRLRQGLDAASAVVLKYFLRFRGLIAGMNDSKDEITERFIEHIERGRLPLDEAIAGIISLQEFSNKRVYLYQLPKATVRDFDLDRLPKRISQWEGVRITHLPDNPVVNYSLVDEKRIRVSYAETHRRIHQNLSNDTLQRIPVTRVVVLQVERNSGFTTLSLDPPETINPHNNNSQEYYDYYTGKAQQLLGGVPARFMINNALMKLESSNLIRIPYGRGRTDDGLVDLVSDHDSRDMGVYTGVKKQTVTKESGRYIWLGGSEAGDRGLPSGHTLHRNIHTEIHAATSMVRFTKDCLQEEVDYVLQQLRAHA